MSGSGLFLSSNRDAHYHHDYRLPKDEIRDYDFGIKRSIFPFLRNRLNKHELPYSQYQSRPDRPFRSRLSEDFCDNRSMDARSYTERRKKTVRFNSEGWDEYEDEPIDQNVDNKWSSFSNVYYNEEKNNSAFPTDFFRSGLRRDSRLFFRKRPSWSARDFLFPNLRKNLWEVGRQESLDSQTKDSGIDSITSSNFNSSEDSNKSDLFRSHRVRKFMYNINKFLRSLFPIKNVLNITLILKKPYILHLILNF